MKENTHQIENEDPYWPKKFIDRQTRLMIITSLIDGPKKWSDLLNITGSALEYLSKHIREMVKAGIVKRKCDAVHLIAPRERVSETIVQAINENEEEVCYLKGLLVKIS